MNLEFLNDAGRMEKTFFSKELEFSKSQGWKVEGNFLVPPPILKIPYSAIIRVINPPIKISTPNFKNE